MFVKISFTVMLNGCNDGSLMLRLLWVHLIVVSWSVGKSVLPLNFTILNIWQNLAMFLLVS